MAMRNPSGRANYQPNSWGLGPREDPERGFRSFGGAEAGLKSRLRPETFADHYTQARMFFDSQTAVEQRHIVKALAFELGRCEVAQIRMRMLAHLRNIDEGLATGVAGLLGVDTLPDPADAAVPPRDMPPSPALSIAQNGPPSFAGRKVGILVCDGFDEAALSDLASAIRDEGATAELIAPKVSGAISDDGTVVPINHALAAAPSVLFDAVVLLLAEAGAEGLTRDARACAFVRDAFAHCKVIGWSDGAEPLFGAAGVDPTADEGLVNLQSDGTETFIMACRQLRIWSREMAVET